MELVRFQAFLKLSILFEDTRSLLVIIFQISETMLVHLHCSASAAVSCLLLFIRDLANHLAAIWRSDRVFVFPFFLVGFLQFTKCAICMQWFLDCRWLASNVSWQIFYNNCCCIDEFSWCFCFRVLYLLNIFTLFRQLDKAAVFHPFYVIFGTHLWDVKWWNLWPSQKGHSVTGSFITNTELQWSVMLSNAKELYWDESVEVTG